jgi:RNA polymerase-binding protein DksA
MNKRARDLLARELRRQREVLFKEVADTEADLQFITENRESELEERAQEEHAARLFARLDDRGKQAIGEIDAALQRISDGTYGRCAGCGRPIPRARLRALPAVRFCVNCARGREKSRPPTVKEEAPHTGRVPGDINLLSDRELQTVIHERVREDGRVDTEELRVRCRQGVIYLSGALPSEAEHSVLLQLLTDTLGLEEIVDRVQVNELLWERKDRSKVPPPEESLPWEEPYGTEDIVESSEEGTDYVPPVDPTPEEK